MTPHEVAHIYGGYRVGEGKWRAKCPAHNGHSHNSLSIHAANDGKTLVKCWGGCPTDEVLQSAGLEWSDLFLPSSLSPSSSSHPCRRIDPKVALQRRAETGLREWKEKAGCTVGYRVWLRHRLIAKGEKLVAEDRADKGADLIALGYLGLSRLEWVADLLESKNREDWLTARRFLI